MILSFSLVILISKKNSKYGRNKCVIFDNCYKFIQGEFNNNQGHDLHYDKE